MQRFYIETYSDEGDNSYHVFADTKEEAEKKLKEYWDQYDLAGETIHKAYGPFNLSDVLPSKG